MIHSRKQIYLDNFASTPCDPRVVQAMIPFFSERYANPSSTTHSMGRDAADAVDQARQAIADLIGARASEICFTSGATEGNNLAILGLATNTNKRHIITCAIEHKSILGPIISLQKSGFEVDILPVQNDGQVNLDQLNDLLSDRTLLVSIQAANNEIGTIQKIATITQIAHAKGALIHCDAVQAAGKIPIDVNEWQVDMMSLSAHKMYGPKGIGALFVRGGGRSIFVSPRLYGGEQEKALRPGTLNVPAIVGFGRAAGIAKEDLVTRIKYLSGLRDKFESIVSNKISWAKINGCLSNRLPGGSNITFSGIDADALIANLPELAISTGSACTSGAPEPSHVLIATGLSRDDAFSTIRVCFGKDNSEEDMGYAAERIVESVGNLRSLLLR